MAQTECKIILDLLNDQPWLDAMQRALDLCDVAERIADRIVAGEQLDPEPLFQAIREFREFFDGYEEE